MHAINPPSLGTRFGLNAACTRCVTKTEKVTYAHWAAPEIHVRKMKPGWKRRHLFKCEKGRRGYGAFVFSRSSAPLTGGAAEGTVKSRDVSETSRSRFTFSSWNLTPLEKEKKKPRNSSSLTSPDSVLKNLQLLNIIVMWVCCGEMNPTFYVSSFIRSITELHLNSKGGNRSLD